MHASSPLLCILSLLLIIIIIIIVVVVVVVVVVSIILIVSIVISTIIVVMIVIVVVVIALIILTRVFLPDLGGTPLYSPACTLRTPWSNCYRTAETIFCQDHGVRSVACLVFRRFAILATLVSAG